MVTLEFADGVTANFESKKAAARHYLETWMLNSKDGDPGAVKITDKETGKVLWEVNDDNENITDFFKFSEFSNKELKKYGKKLQNKQF